MTVQPEPLAGYRSLLHFMVRRDRLRMSVWILGVTGVAAASTTSTVGLYGGSDADLVQYARLATADEALKTLAGPGYGLDDPTIGAVVMNETAMNTMIAVALMAVFMMIRHTRAEEESDRAELVRSGPVGRHAALVAAGTWVAAAIVLIGVGLVGIMRANGLPIEGSLAFGTSVVAIGWTFVAVAAVAAQVAASARAALAAAGVLLGVSFMLRALGDLGNAWGTWSSPLGWTLAIRSFAGERWWVLVLPAGATAALSIGAVAISARRDLGAGWFDQRPGPATASPWLSSPLALAMRLQRNLVVGWAIGLGLTGFAFGLIADQADALLENETIAEMFAQAGAATPTESFLATMLLMLALMTSGFTVSSALRLRTEEVNLRASPMLASAVSRRAWLWSHVVVAASGSLGIMVIAGAAAGIGSTTKTGDVGEVVDLAIAAVALMPALLVVVGVTVALFGISVRWAPAAWLAVVVSVVVGVLAETLNLPVWVRDISPFQHVPRLPAASFDPIPLIVLSLVATGLMALGTLAIGRRDIA